jgi:hypothetical protein
MFPINHSSHFRREWAGKMLPWTASCSGVKMK